MSYNTQIVPYIVRKLMSTEMHEYEPIHGYKNYGASGIIICERWN